MIVPKPDTTVAALYGNLEKSQFYHLPIKLANNMLKF